MRWFAFLDMNNLVLDLKELKKRRDNLRNILQNNQIDFAWIFHHPDVYYFTGTAQNATLVVPAVSESALFVKKYLPRAKSETDMSDVKKCDSPSEISKWLLDRSNTKKEITIGIEKDVLPAYWLEKIKSLLPKATFKDISQNIRWLRSVKSENEIQCIKKAANLLDRIFDCIPRWLRLDMTELELAAKIEYELRIGGHQGHIPVRGFNSFIHFGNVLFGKNSAVRGAFDGPTCGSGLYNASPKGAGWNKLKAHEPVFVDIVAGISGYIADGTRIYSIGSLPDELVSAHNICLSIQQSITETPIAGIACEIPGIVAKCIVEEHNLSDKFMGPYDDQAAFVGHGVGLEIDELPVLAPGNKHFIPENSVVALEPKFVFHNLGTVGIENVWHITQSETRRLTHFPDCICECS